MSGFPTRLCWTCLIVDGEQALAPGVSLGGLRHVYLGQGKRYEPNPSTQFRRTHHQVCALISRYTLAVLWQRIGYRRLFYQQSRPAVGSRTRTLDGTGRPPPVALSGFTLLGWWPVLIPGLSGGGRDYQLPTVCLRPSRLLLVGPGLTAYMPPRVCKLGQTNCSIAHQPAHSPSRLRTAGYLTPLLSMKPSHRVQSACVMPVKQRHLPSEVFPVAVACQDVRRRFWAQGSQHFPQSLFTF